jgi:uncharacterized protein YjbI with pentapeptide repeats
MSGEELSRAALPEAIVGPMSHDELRRYLSPRSDITYRKIENLTASDIDINQSLLTGSIIRDSVFTKVIFSRSDLDGMRIERSTFVECDFTSCDFRASLFARCKFQSCVLDSTFIDDCEFQFCEFTDSTLRVGSITHCRFQESSLHSCDLKQATFLHNKLYDSSISAMILGDCALQYIILRNCTLTDVTLSAESVGAIFGLTWEQLAGAKMVYLGKDEILPDESEILSVLFEEYKKRRWYIGQLVLSVNFGLASTLSAFDDYLLLAHERFVELGFANGDELEFLGDLLSELAFLNELPLLTALNILEWCTRLEGAIRRGSQELPEASGDSVSTLAGRLSLLTNTMLDKFDRAMPELGPAETNRALCVRVTFRRVPDIPLPDLLNSLAAGLRLGGADRSQRIRIESGSYVDVILTTLLTVVALQAFLYLINGCVIQLTELKHRVKVLARKDAPKTYKDIALSPVQQPSPIILSVLRGLTEYAKGLGWLKGASLSGYTASNIKSLQEVECDNSQEPQT